MFSRFFIERPIFANVIAIVTVLIGAVALYGLPIEQYPEITPPTVQVRAVYPGANADYGPGFISGTHTAWRHRDYVFIADEVFPPFPATGTWDVGSIRAYGRLQVIDVSDIERPGKVAEYAVPEAGAHNMWVTDDDVMVMGYYNGGGRVVDVSGELRGNLYRQGREIARLWTGDPKGWRPNLPFTWGAQPHRGLIYFNDINSGIWITRLPPLKTAPTQP